MSADMVNNIPRGSYSFDDHLDQVVRDAGVDGIIRIQEKEYDAIDSAKTFYTHFNLAATSHEIGKVYALPRIIEPGYFNHITGEEKKPVLSFENIYRGTCVAIRNNVSYDDLMPEDFEYSMLHIKDADSLWDCIHERYHQSMPALSAVDMKALGVGITTIRIESASLIQ